MGHLEQEDPSATLGTKGLSEPSVCFVFSYTFYFLKVYTFTEFFFAHFFIDNQEVVLGEVYKKFTVSSHLGL